MSNARTTKPDPDSIPPVDLARAKRVIRPGKRRLTLRGIREGLNVTQVQVAEALGIEQGDVSKLERRNDVRVSTLRRYAKALGATCEVAIVLKTGQRIEVAELGEEG